MQTTKVISLGGSLVAPDDIATDYLRQFTRIVNDYLNKDKNRRLIFVVGGGQLARRYQEAYQNLSNPSNNDTADWIGIAATRLNAQLIKSLFEDRCAEEVVTDPTSVESFQGTVLVASGWKPGFSTDYDAVLLAEHFGAKILINLTNIAKVYSGDPRVDKGAKPIDNMSWVNFRSIIGDEWTPGKNAPFDPIAARKAQEMRLTVISAQGSDIENVRHILDDKNYIGTTIGPN